METKQNPVKAIRKKCLDCAGESAREVLLCPIESCALHPFRLGKNPFRRPRSLTKEQREAARERLKHARAALTTENEAASFSPVY